jgi:hypothetical protein
MATTTNYGWTTPDDTALVKDGASAIRTLGTSVDTTTKNLNPSTTLGDIEYRSSTANTNTRLGIGSTGNILTVAGGVPTWAAPAASGGMTLISTYTANNTAATFTISSIAGTYKHLLLVGTALQSSSTGNLVNFRLNGDTGANYTGTGFGFYAGGLQSIQPTGDVEASIYRTMARSTDTILRFGVFDMWIYDYASTSNRKNFSYRAGASNDGSLSSVSFNGFWNNSADAITSITVYAAANFNAGTFKLYGVS